LVLEWVLDFPGKIRALLIKAGIVIVALLAGLIAKNWEYVKPFFNIMWGELKLLGGLISTLFTGFWLGLMGRAAESNVGPYFVNPTANSLTSVLAGTKGSQWC
jgi:hypothetical protein